MHSAAPQPSFRRFVHSFRQSGVGVDGMGQIRSAQTVPYGKGSLGHQIGGVGSGDMRPKDFAAFRLANQLEQARKLAEDIGFELKDLPSGEKSGGSDGQFCVDWTAVLDGLGPFGGGGAAARRHPVQPRLVRS